MYSQKRGLVTPFVCYGGVRRLVVVPEDQDPTYPEELTSGRSASKDVSAADEAIVLAHDAFTKTRQTDLGFAYLVTTPISTRVKYCNMSWCMDVTYPGQPACRTLTLSAPQ